MIECARERPLGILEIIPSRNERLGPLEIRRALPNASRTMIGPFIFMDQGGPIRVPRTPQSGVGEHPHAGLCTFTYLLSGHGYHLDSAGHSARIEAGDIALMTAGRGITHEERPHPEDPATELDIYFVQMWIALPDAAEDMPPAFELHRQTDLPERTFEQAHARVLIGDAWDLTAPTTQYTPTLFADLTLGPKGAIEIDDQYTERALYVLEGHARVDHASMPQHTLSLLAPGQTVHLESDQGCRVILFGGDAFPTRRFIAGSYVGSSMDKIRQWDAAYRSGQFPKIAR